MILLIMGNKQLTILEKIMSKFLDDFNAALEKVAVGSAGDPETKAAVAALQKSMTDTISKVAVNDEDDAVTKQAVSELNQAVLALTNKLAESTPPTP